MVQIHPSVRLSLVRDDRLGLQRSHRARILFVSNPEAVNWTATILNGNTVSGHTVGLLVSWKTSLQVCYRSTGLTEPLQLVSRFTQKPISYRTTARLSSILYIVLYVQMGIAPV